MLNFQHLFNFKSLDLNRYMCVLGSTAWFSEEKKNAIFFSSDRIILSIKFPPIHHMKLTFVKTHVF